MMFDRLPCRPAPTSWRPLVEWVSLCSLAAAVLYYLGA